MFKFILLSIIALGFIGCNKPQPNPELKDPIYLDLVAQLGGAEKALVDAKAQLQEQVDAKKKVIPQTGQNKFVDKRFFAAENLIAKVEQQKKYWQILVEQRKIAARASYLDSFYKKLPWPDPKEFEAYQAKKKAETPPRPWNQTERIENYRKSMKLPKQAPKPAGAEAPAEKPK